MTKKKMTPKDFAPHLLAVLADLTEYEPNVSVPMTETYKPVCERMGIDEDFGGEVKGGYKFTHRNIGLAFRQHLRGKGLGDQAKKGEWMLTQLGVDEARGDDFEDREEESPVAAKADAVEKIEEEYDDSAEVLHLPVKSQHPYSDDPYIVSLAIDSTPCFGAYSKRSKACKECLLAQDCRVQVRAVKGALAGELEEEERLEAERQARQAREAAKKNSSVEELMESFKNEEEEGSSKSKGKSGKFKPPPGQEFAVASMSRESVCLQCQGKIAQGEEGIWCQNEGVFHIECFDAS